MPEKERVYIAQIEHQGLTLTRKGFPAMAAAIRAADYPKLIGFFSPAFGGQTLDPDQGKGPQNEALTVHRAVSSSASNSVRKNVDAASFAKYLLDLRARFAPEVKVELALMSLTPVDRDKVDGAWQGSCAFRIAGPRVRGDNGELMAKIEFDMAAIPDVDTIATNAGWVSSLRVAEMQDSTASHPLMAEVAKERGIDRSLFQDNWSMLPGRRAIVTGGVYLADIDNDGRDDILVTDMKGLFLFHGLEGGRFEEITTQSGLPQNLRGAMNAAFGDFDNDGLVDLILHNRIYRNLGGGRFQEVAQLPDKLEGMSGFTLADYDKDGRLDIYVTRHNSSETERARRNSWIDGPGGPGNQLWRNLGNWKFEEVSQAADATAGHRSCFTAAWLDANNDGWPDIYAINEFGGGVLMLNQGNGTFKEQALLDDAGDFGSMGMAVGDFDNDGNIDIYTANMYSKAGRRIMENLPPGSYPPEIFAKIKRFVVGSEMYRNQGGLKFERSGKALRVHSVGWAYGAAFVDLDNDGFLDLYATAGFMSVSKEEPDG